MKHNRKDLSYLFPLFILLPIAYFLLPFSSEPSDDPRIDALAPVEVVAEHFVEPTGVAVDQSNAIFVSDRDSGDIFKIVGSDIRLLVQDLRRPVGLGFDGQQRLLIVEESRGRLLRLETDSRLTVLAQRMKRPRWLTAAEDGAVYISAQGLRREGESDEEGEEDGEVVLRLSPLRELSVWVEGFKGLQGLVVHERNVFAVAKGLRSETEERGGVFRIPILADGRAGAITRFTQSETKKPFGLVRDRLGALYISAEEISLQSRVRKAIGKVALSGAVSRFASNLEEPRGLALDNQGNLLVADDRGGTRGRLLRFRAPPPPTVAVPQFTNRSPLTVPGSTEKNSRIDAFLNHATTPITVSTQDGSFELTLSLLLNRQNLLDVFSTAHDGLGLTSAAAEFTIVHDNIPPVIGNLSPPSGSFLNNPRPLIRADFSDNLSGVDVARVEIRQDGFNVTAQAQVTAGGFTFTPANPLSEGSHTVSVSVFDRAGNSALASTTFTIDVTPPQTRIVAGPEGTVSATSVTFTVAGTDNLTPPGSLVFAWRLDGGPFSPFSPQTQISLSGLSPGLHTFEVKARDLAGNEDPTPARRTFTVSVLTVRITEPRDGASVAPGSLLVGGTVEAGGAEVGVLVNGFGAAVQGSSFAALIPVNTGTTSLTAVATTAAGATASHRVNITVSQTPAPAVALGVSPRSGVAPLRVEFSLLGGVVPTRVELDANGNGTTDFTGPTLDRQAFTYTQPGLYFPAATVIDNRGNRLTATSIVQVLKRNALDTMLQAKWNGVKQALTAGDVSGALNHIVARARNGYTALFTAFGPKISVLGNDMPIIQPVYFEGDYAKYRLRRQQRIGDQVMTITHYVYFSIDDDGIWRIESF